MGSEEAPATRQQHEFATPSLQIDLACCEKDGVIDDCSIETKEEGRHINLSLTQLGICVKMLRSQEMGVIPWSGNELTRLLKPLLISSSSRLVFLVNVGGIHAAAIRNSITFGLRMQGITYTRFGRSST